MSAKGQKIEPEPDISNVSQSETSTNQEATAIPMFCGEAKIPVRWISEILGQFAKPAPSRRPGKK